MKSAINRMSIRRSGALLALFALQSCDMLNLATEPYCGDTELVIHISPMDTSLKSGATLHPNTYLADDCGNHLPSNMRFLSGDTTIARVLISSRLLGGPLILAQRTGETTIEVRDARHGHVGEIRVVVTAPK